MVQRHEDEEEKASGLVVLIKINDEGMQAGITGGANRDGIMRVVGAMELLKTQLLKKIEGDVDG